ncbi:DUF418 domain-containing protein [Streptomyces sp. NBC_01429]|uniref:DUF418 domain-containing protein n=1 Tax=Streptomyces sp. NBC_01429 TaxID=2903862 RepID=UPI002E2BBC91|nr:DUF418 domain-containing protein [Streptomyces sp. NBC_01429]
MTTPAQSGPVRSSGAGPGRLMDVDALRGVALFGILMVNIGFFASGYTLAEVPDPARGAWHDALATGVIQFLFEAKSYLLFSFLFGYSFTLQVDSAGARGRDFRPLFLRRLGGLFLLGVVNGVLLFHGDILVTYAVLGLMLFLLRGLAPRRALWVAGIITGSIALGLLLIAVLATLFDGAAASATASEHAASLAEGRAATEAMRGGVGSVIGERVSALGATLPLVLFFQGPLAFSAFLVGLAAGKRRLFADAGLHDGKLKLAQLIGFPVGLAGSAFLTFAGGDNLFAGAVHLVTAPCLTAAYVATLLRVFRTGRGARLAGVLARPGRMALTNYLSQSLLCVLIFTGIGLGLVGRVPYVGVMGIALAIYGVQLAWSAWWLRRFRMGPAEWLLRAATHLERPALRVRRDTTAQHAPVPALSD